MKQRPRPKEMLELSTRIHKQANIAMYTNRRTLSAHVITVWLGGPQWVDACMHMSQIVTNGRMQVCSAYRLQQVAKNYNVRDSRMIYTRSILSPEVGTPTSQALSV